MSAECLPGEAAAERQSLWRELHGGNGRPRFRRRASPEDANIYSLRLQTDLRRPPLRLARLCGKIF